LGDAGIDATDDTVHGAAARVHEDALSGDDLRGLARGNLELRVKLILPRDAADRAARLQLLTHFDVDRLHNASNAGDDLQVRNLRFGAIQGPLELGHAGLLDRQLGLNVVTKLLQPALFKSVGLRLL